MDTTLVNDFMKDLKIEAVKLQLQLAAPSTARQNNDVLGTITDGELDSVHSMTVIRGAIADLGGCASIVDLHEVYDRWNEARLEIQYAGYGYTGSERAKRMGEAYAYVFLMRVLKKRHKDLYVYMKMAL